MTTIGEREVPDLKVADNQGFFAQWDDEDGVVRVYQHDLGESITLSPNELRLLYGWVEAHELT